MRYQGRVTEWRDDKGFGFVTPNGGGERAFLHISAFSSRHRRPAVDDLVSYEVVLDDKRRPQARTARFYGEAALASPLRANDPLARSGMPWMRFLFGLLVLAVLALLGFQAYDGGLARLAPRPTSANSIGQFEGPEHGSRFEDPAPPSRFKCDGRIHCSQMQSCAEATYFVRNCPNTRMDGDGDGIACEQQWCE